MIVNFNSRFFVKPAQLITPTLAKTKITPNQVTVLRFIIGIPLAVYLFSKGQYLTNLLAMVVLYVSSVFDYVDGILARNYDMKSEIGAWLDEFEDKITQVVILMGLSWGVFIQQGRDLNWLFVGLALVLGTNIQTFIGTEFQKKYNLYYDTLLKFWPLFNNKKMPWRDKFLKDYLAPKSFFYTLISTYIPFILVGIVFNIMPWVLVLMAILGNLHWMILVYIYVRCVVEKKPVSLLVKNIRELKKIT